MIKQEYCSRSLFATNPLAWTAEQCTPFPLLPTIDKMGMQSPANQFFYDVHFMPSRTWIVAAIMNSRLQHCSIQHGGIRVLNESGPSILGPQVYVQRLINAMKTHIVSTTIIYDACRGLLYWSKKDECVLQEIGKVQNAAVLIDALNHQSSRSLSLRYMILDILKTLVVVCSMEWLQSISSHMDLVGSILRLLKGTTLEAFTQQVGLSILSWVVEDKSSRDIIIKEGGVEYLLDAMKMHTWDDVVQCNAAATLCWIIHVSDFPNPSRLGPTCLTVVLNTMQRFLNNAKIFANSLCILSGILSLSSREQGFHVPHLQFADLALVGMDLHHTFPKVHRNGLTLLRFLLIHDEESDEICSIVMKNVDVIKNSMKLHGYDSGIQADACEILAHLVSASEATKETIKESGCIELVVQSQLEHRGDLRLQHNALFFHRCLLRGPLSEAEVSFGGHTQVLHTMASSITFPEVPTDL